MSVFTANKIEDFQCWSIKILIYLIPCLPLLVTPSIFFPYITGKNFAFRILVEFSAALWIGLIIFNRKYRPGNSIITISILAFTFIVGLADIVGVNPYKSFWSNYERMEGYITILHLVLYFIIIKSVLRTKKEWMIFFNIFFIVSVFVAFLSLAFHTTDTITKFSLETFFAKRYAMEYGTRLHGTIGNPPFLASYLLLSLFLGMVLISTFRKIYLKGLCLAGVIWLAVVIYLTASRGAILAAIAGAVILIVLNLFRRSDTGDRRLMKKFIALCIVIALIISSIFFVILTRTEIIKSDKTLARFAMMFQDQSGKSRLDIWKVAWEGIKKRPVLGWGQENLIAVYSVNPVPFKTPQIWLDRAHNIVIEWLVNAGVLGLLSYLLIFGVAFFALWKSVKEKSISKKEAIAIFTALAVYFFQNLLIFDTINTYLIFFTLLAYVDSVGALKDSSSSCSEGTVKPVKGNVLLPAVTLTALLLVVFTCYHLNYKPIRQSQKAVKIGTFDTRKDSFSDLLDRFNHLLGYETFGDTNIRDMMSFVSASIIDRKLFEKEGSWEFIQATERELRKEIAMNPLNLRYLTDVIILYQKIAGYAPLFSELSEELTLLCINLNPEYEWPYFALADIYVSKKEYEKTFAIVNKLASQDPRSEWKLIKLALAAILTYREDVVHTALQNLKKIRAGTAARASGGGKQLLALGEMYAIAKTYSIMGNYSSAINFLEEIIPYLSDAAASTFDRDHTFKKPKVKASIHFEAAQIYLNLDRKEEAIQAAEKAKELYPEGFSDEVEKFIEIINK